MRGTRRMWLRRFLRIGDHLAWFLRGTGRGVRTIGSFISEFWGIILMMAIVVSIIGGLGRLMWWDIFWSPQNATTQEVKDAMAKNTCISDDLKIRIKQGRPISHRTIYDLTDTCKAQAEQRAAIATQSTVVPDVPVQVRDRWATPDEVKKYASLPDTCVKVTIPGWRKNIGGGPLHYSDLNDIVNACREQHVLDDQLAAIPKDK